MILSTQLAGAMGLASWRAHLALRDFASAAPLGTSLAGKKTASSATPVALSLNEVGVTDSVMATMWRCGPFSWSASTTGPAEKTHFGADVAIVDVPRKRLILYQAKLAKLTPAGDLVFKTHVPTGHVRLLRQASVVVDGVTFRVTGRLAIYQIGYMPPGSNFAGVALPGGVLLPWSTDWSDAIQYYNDVLMPHSLSPHGVLAAAIPTARGPVKSLTAADTWPWEFDAYHWILGIPSYLDFPPADRVDGGDWIHPEWRDDNGKTMPPASVMGTAFAAELHRSLHLPRRHQLHVVGV